MTASAAIRSTAEGPPPVPTPWELPSKGRVGMAGLIVTESSFFAIFVVAYLFYVGKSLSGPYPADVLELPILGSICLLSSSVTIVLAVRALRAGAVSRFALWWLVTILLGLEFLVVCAGLRDAELPFEQRGCFGFRSIGPVCVVAVHHQQQRAPIVGIEQPLCSVEGPGKACLV